jgi:hypothetical protein
MTDSRNIAVYEAVARAAQRSSGPGYGLPGGVRAARIGPPDREKRPLLRLCADCKVSFRIFELMSAQGPYVFCQRSMVVRWAQPRR